MAFVISAGCVDVKDKSCMTDCPVDCIYEGERMSYIQPLECIDCGACVPLCPEDAIYFEQDLPLELRPYARVNEEFFDTIGSPGSSVGLDLTDRDHDAVRALPARSIP